MDKNFQKLSIRFVNDKMMVTLTQENCENQEKLQKDFRDFVDSKMSDEEKSLAFSGATVEIVSQFTIDNNRKMTSILEEIASDPDIDEELGKRIDALLGWY